MSMIVLLVVVLVLVLVLFVAGFRTLAVLLLLALLGMLAYLGVGRRASVQGLPTAPVILQSEGGLYPNGQDSSGTILH